MLRAFTLLLICQLAGEVTAVLTGLPIPGPVVGLFYLLIGLMVYRTPTPWLETTS
ncbi:MAG TPA: CidA/LrgA family protein, partial [Rhodospirillaceae bacterium]|nr:CidA/LrgA family protein [Rhodospirillaceae bacterium]